jgi:hypothetical protein
MGYQAARHICDYIFVTKLKMSRKSYINKDSAAEAVFKKTLPDKLKHIKHTKYLCGSYSSVNIYLGD